MITYVKTSVLDSPAQTLVNTVNTVGVMGKGIAKQFKEKFPAMFVEYKRLCDKHALQVGKLHLWRSPTRWVLNFPTKTTWRQPSRLEYIEAGLETFVRSYSQMGITSVSFPPLGCGNGNLDWRDVRPIMEKYLEKTDIQVYIHDIQVPSDYVPEHVEGFSAPPEDYIAFLADIKTIVDAHHGRFTTLKSSHPFTANFGTGEDIEISSSGKRSEIPSEHLESAWSTLQNGFLTYEQFQGADDRRSKSYLFAILVHLPYMRIAELKRADWNKAISAHGLFLDQARNTETTVALAKPKEETWQLAKREP